ncbi:hypothetical protein GTY75_04940 [Streptomyces sp. SID8381]|uniref:hypothetical protein n=1 Tax=unclassified Streptomyces TaxID=2593676 RepID=UPI0003824058|nr:MULTISPECIES: hypothetical protein [unclassified Streptomyces]MYX26020.1 hypothetical protein [Streptomyces sp. SID8381]
MKLSELIADADRTLKEEGDIPVVVPDPGCGCCKTYTFEPAESKVETDAEAYDDSWQPVKFPAVYVVR